MAGRMDKIERIEASLAVKCVGKLTAYRRFDLGAVHVWRSYAILRKLRILIDLKRDITAATNWRTK